MKTDPTPEVVMPDTISPAEDSMLASVKQRLEELGVKTIEEVVALNQIGPKEIKGAHPQVQAKDYKESRARWRSKKIRDKSLSREELPRKKRALPQRQTFSPLWDGEQLRAKLQSYDRTPFLDLLAVWMECTPNVQDIMAFASKHPDRFMHSMSLIAKMGGFTEKKEVEINLSAQVTALSDSQLEDRLRDYAYKMGIPLPKALTLKAIDMEVNTLKKDDISIA